MSQAAQATKPLTENVSFETIFSLVEIGIADICCQRQFLPKDDFETIHVEGLPSSDTKKIREGAGPKAKVIREWIHTGVRTALTDGYIRKLIFGIASDAACREVLEEYVFTFDRDDAGNFGVKLSSGKQHRVKAPPTTDNVKTQVMRLLRRLVNITATLSDIPDSYTIFMKMQYHPNTPEDYEPPLFEAAGDRAVGYFPTKPLAIRIDSVNTPYHAFEVGVRSVIDNIDVVPGKGATADDVTRWQQTTKATGNEPTGDDLEDSADQCGPRGAKASSEFFSEPHHAALQQEDGRAVPADEKLIEKLRRWTEGRATVDAIDAYAHFLEAKESQIDAALDNLVKHNVLRPTKDANVFSVVDIAAQLGNLRMGKATGSAPSSIAADIHSAPGSMCTHSRGRALSRRQPSVHEGEIANHDDNAGGDEVMDEAGAEYSLDRQLGWTESQPGASQHPRGKAPKVSIVKKPVPVKRKPLKRKAGKSAPAVGSQRGRTGLRSAGIGRRDTAAPSAA